MVMELLLKQAMKGVGRWCKSCFVNSPDPQLSDNKKKHNKDPHDLLVKFCNHKTHEGIISIFSHETNGVVEPYDPHDYILSDSAQLSVLGCHNGVVCLRRPHGKPKCDANILGFGFDAKNDDYKLVSIEGYLSSHSDEIFYDVEVYSLKWDSWRWVTSINNLDNDLHLPPSMTEGVYTNENEMYSWRVTYRGKEAIMSFEMSKEIIIFTPLPRPSCLHPYGYLTNLMDMNGRLAFLHMDPRFFSIWWLGELGVEHSWSKLISIPLAYGLWPMAFWKNVGLVLRRLDDENLVLLDIATQRRKLLPISIPCSAESAVFSFKPSMVPLN
ncbi:hypothetical protein FNV43_RR14699 [Rhamnella rubrinervis]|uniref:F-box associated beta-propeller type 3 domain-containing protein n=1 Tax=Rhamnella rubrinervis TaxID=2594499 RepID=A0A8K0H3A3_9ROSA|nr:hypothetical protein FNV43_RR14699 [Rhamnella rubrinervis]